MVIGLTGGIGSGKSTVAKLFEVLGCAIFHSDEAARDVYFEPDVKEKVISLLGESSYLSATRINKADISSKIFGNTELLHALNAIIHPAVGKAFAAFKAAHPNTVIVKESALLFEGNLLAGLDKIVVVASPDEMRIERVMQRDGHSREEVMLKMKSQLPQEEKIKRADFVIHNNEKEFLITQVLAVFNALKV